MLEQDLKSTDQSETVQNSVVSTQTTEGAMENSSSRPSARDISSVRTARLQKKIRIGNLKNALANVLAILKRGYHKIEVASKKKSEKVELDAKKEKTFKKVELDAAEREYLKAKAGAFRMEIFALKEEIKDYTQELRSLSSRAKSANSRDLKTLQENARMKKISNEVVAKVKNVITKDTVSQYPTLASFAKDSKDNSFVDLETFFSVNLAGEFKKFSSDPKLTARIYDRTIKHIKKISQ